MVLLRPQGQWPLHAEGQCRGESQSDFYYLLRVGLILVARTFFFAVKRNVLPTVTKAPLFATKSSCPLTRCVGAIIFTLSAFLTMYNLATVSFCAEQSHVAGLPLGLRGHGPALAALRRHRAQVSLFG